MVYTWCHCAFVVLVDAFDRCSMGLSWLFLISGNLTNCLGNIRMWHDHCVHWVMNNFTVRERHVVRHSSTSSTQGLYQVLISPKLVPLLFGTLQFKHFSTLQQLEECDSSSLTLALSILVVIWWWSSTISSIWITALCVSQQGGAHKARAKIFYGVVCWLQFDIQGLVFNFEHPLVRNNFVTWGKRYQPPCCCSWPPFCMRRVKRLVIRFRFCNGSSIVVKKAWETASWWNVW